MFEWCSVVKGGLRVHLIPKVAHSALSYSIRDKQLYRTSPEEDSEDTRFMVVRHPLDRIVSAWSFFCKERHHAPFNEGMAKLGYSRTMSFSEFLDHLLEHHDKNVHTMKQIKFTGGQDIHILIPIEKLNEKWPELVEAYGLSPFQNSLANSSQHEDWMSYYTPEQRVQTEEVFQEDLNLYNLTLEKYNG